MPEDQAFVLASLNARGGVPSPKEARVDVTTLSVCRITMPGGAAQRRQIRTVLPRVTATI